MNAKLVKIKLLIKKSVLDFHRMKSIMVDKLIFRKVQNLIYDIFQCF